MKICLINNLYEPYSRGGADTVVKNILNGLAAAGHEVFLITLWKHQRDCHPDDPDSSQGRKDLVATTQINNYRIYHTNPRNIFSYIDINNKPAILRLIWWFFNVFNWSGRSQVKKILQMEKPDVVLTHNLIGISFLVPRLLKKMGWRHIHTLHDIQLAYPSGQLIWEKEKNFINTFFLRVGYEKLTRKLFGSPDVVISPSKWLLEFYTEKGFFKKSQKEIISNPVSKSLVTSYKLRVTDYKPFHFLFVGTVGEYKGILFLIKIIKNISGDFILRVVGEGRDLEKAKELAGGDTRIEFLGRKNKTELAEIYQNSDCLILPTLTYENLPTVILEAFSFGLPVVASKIGGIPELVAENKTGWLFEPGNEEELKQIIEKILSKIEEVDKMRKECLEKAREFGAEEYIEKVVNLIN